jgi:hypothetical protein
MSNPINLITESINKINNNLDLIESNINNSNSVDNVKEQICNICSYNKRLNQSYTILKYAIIVQPELAPVLAAINSLSEILKHFCNACADYDNNKTVVLDQLKPYISQLKESLNTVQELINKNKKYIDSAYAAYEKTKSFSQYIPKLTQPELAAAAGGYKRRQNRLSKRSRSKRKQSNRLSKRKSIKKKSKKNRRR